MRVLEYQGSSKGYEAWCRQNFTVGLELSHALACAKATIEFEQEVRQERRAIRLGKKGAGLA
jgi:hypothetical protein